VSIGRRIRNLDRLRKIGEVAIKHGFGCFLERYELQDAMAPFSFEEVDATLRQELGLGVDRLFTAFADEPIAAASVGQVHRARLPNGEGVPVKVKSQHLRLEVMVRRPGVMVNRLVLAVLIAALVVGASLVAVCASGGPRLFGMHAFGVVGLALAACFGVWVMAAMLTLMAAFLVSWRATEPWLASGDPWLGGLVVGSRVMVVTLLVVSLVAPPFNVSGNVVPLVMAPASHSLPAAG
jgi:hypothetical protein